MSVKQMSLVWELDLDPNKKIILLAYADHADDDGDNVYPSLGRMAHKTGYSIDQVRRISRQLLKDNLMELVEKGHGRGNPNRYKLTLEKGSKLPPFKPKHAEPEKVASEKEKVASSHEKGSIAVPPEPSSLEPSVKNHSRRDGKPPQEKPTNYFDVFTEAAKTLGYEVTTEDRKELPANLKRLAQEHDDAFMRKVVRRCLAARADRQYALSPQRARDELQGGEANGHGEQTAVKSSVKDGYEWLFN